MVKIILESKYHMITVGELISLLEKYSKDLPFYYTYNGSIEGFEIAEVFNELRRQFNPDNLKLMFLAITNKKNKSSNGAIIAPIVQENHANSGSKQKKIIKLER